MNIAIDLDGTFNRFPVEFKLLLNTLSKDNDIYIISGRKVSDMEKSKVELREVNFKEMILFPDEYQDSQERVSKQIGRWKGEMCKEYKIDIYLENDPIQIASIREVNPNVIILQVI